MKGLDTALEKSIACFSNHTLDSTIVLSEKKMGFSGACVMEIACEWTPPGPPEKLFVKNIVLESLPEDADARAKALRNRQSYKNEVAVIENFAPILREKAGLQIPMTHRIEHSTGDEEAFLFISDSLNEVADQLPVYTKEQCQAVLQWMARMHAFYWGHEAPPQSTRVDPNSIHESGVWAQGTHLAYAKRPKKEIDSMVGIWESFCNEFEWPELLPIGARLGAVAERLGEYLSSHATRNRELLTVVHGDFKPGNIFLAKAREEASGTSGDDSPQQQCGLPADASGGVHIIDFQWTGLGLASTDVAYFLAMAPSDEFLATIDVKKDFLEHYFTSLQTAYAAFHNGETLSYSMEQFEVDFQVSLCDFVRWVVPGRLGNETPKKYEERRAKLPWDMNTGAYRRSTIMMRFLMESVRDYLPQVEALVEAS